MKMKNEKSSKAKSKTISRPVITAIQLASKPNSQKNAKPAASKQAAIHHHSEARCHKSAQIEPRPSGRLTKEEA